MEFNQESCKSCVILHCCNLVQDVNNFDFDLNYIVINFRVFVSICVIFIRFLFKRFSRAFGDLSCFFLGFDLEDESLFFRLRVEIV